MKGLQIFEKHPAADAYRFGPSFAPHAIVATPKRFTDAELTAEYWHDYSIYVRECSNLLHCQERYMEAAGLSFKEAEQKCAVMYRFATHPHYDEDTP